MKSKQIMAVVLTATMVLGSTVTAFASDVSETTEPTDASSATGTGTAFEHVDKEIMSVTLPTTAEVSDVFDYYVDPERLINDAGTLADGTTEVEGNADGVYFKNTGSASSGSEAVDASVTGYLITHGGSQVSSGLTVTVPTTTEVALLTYKTVVDDGTDGIASNGWYDESNTEVTPVEVIDDNDPDTPVAPSSGDTITVTPYQAAQAGSAAAGYSSSSDAVKFEGKNSVDVDVSVAAAVTASAGGKDIELVKDADALTAAKAPALLMKLKVGDDEKVITSSGVTASAKIAGVPNNFAVTTESGKYVYKVHPDENNGGTALAPWGSTTVQLIGKTNTANVPKGTAALTAPQITLTWTIKKHSDAYASATTVSADNKALTLNMPEGVTVSSVVLNLNGTPTTLGSGTHYTVSGKTLTISKYAASWVNGTLTITYSDQHTDTIECK